MGTNEKISVIMPVYNAEDTVGKTIGSILCQSYRNFELIIVDDGSSDGTAQVCGQFDSCKIVCCRQQNAGPAAARNLGLSKAAGELVCFVDADDTVREDYLQVLADSISGADLAVCVYRTLDADVPGEQPVFDVFSAAVSGEHTACEASPAGSVIREPAAAVMKRILHDDTVGGFLWNKIFRRKLIEENGIRFSKNIFVGEDLLFVEQYLAVCDTVSFTDKALYNYYSSGDSISHAMTGKNLTMLRALEKIRGLSDDPDFVRTVAIRYVRQFLAFAARFPEEDCPPGRLSSFLKNTGLPKGTVFAGLKDHYKIKYMLYKTSRKLYRKIMGAGRN